MLVTLAELRASAETAIAWSATHGMAFAGFQVVVPGDRQGLRARVAPGLTGEVLSTTDTGTVVMLDARRVLAWLDAQGAR